MSTRITGRVRPPAAAGRFYPDDPDELRAAVDGLLDAAGPTSGPVPRALIVPHAGYGYSGPVAASAYATVRGAAARLRRVALLGPAHFVPLAGAVVPVAEAWRTPLGDVPIDLGLRRVAQGAGAAADDEPHEPEHAIEVQLPFLLRLLGPDLRVLPVAVGASTADTVAGLIEALAAEADLVVVSTDLSHYHDLAAARRLDRRTAEAVTARDPDAIASEDACGVFALRGLVEAARRDDRSIRLLDLRTSADTAGDPRRVVGYGAFAVA